MYHSSDAAGQDDLEFHNLWNKRKVQEIYYPGLY